MTFDFSYIKRIGVDLNEVGKHRCTDPILKLAHRIDDKSTKGRLLTDIELKAIDHLCGLVILLFGPALRLVAIPLTFDVSASPSGTFRTPINQADSIKSTGYDWPQRSVTEGEYALSQLGLYQFVYNTRSTYSIAKIETGNGSGAYLLKIKSASA
jgi:hypothetical protein